jgi:hypothetical protein
MSKAEAAQKALRTELDKLKETASAAHNLHLESEGKKVKYLQSELEKVGWPTVVWNRNGAFSMLVDVAQLIVTLPVWFSSSRKSCTVSEVCGRWQSAGQPSWTVKWVLLLRG